MSNVNHNFSFNVLREKKIKSIWLNLETSKACQNSYIATRTIAENTDILTNYLFWLMNNAVMHSEFS